MITDGFQLSKCSLNPSGKTFDKLKPYIQEAYEYAKEKYAKEKYAKKKI